MGQGKFAELKIKTTSVCKTCKETIENDLSFAKGVKQRFREPGF
jgi:hypothetical protein